MTYEELLNYCARAVGASSASSDANLHSALRLLRHHEGTSRMIAAETICQYMAEFIEQHEMRAVKAPNDIVH